MGRGKMLDRAANNAVHYEYIAGNTLILTWLRKMSAYSAGHMFIVIYTKPPWFNK